MSKYERLKNKYNKIIKKSLNDNKDKIIDSFVEYYGEKYRNIIETKYEEISFVYYIDWKTVNLVIKKFIPISNDTKRYKAFIKFYNSHNRKKLLSKLFKNKENKDKLPDNLVGTTNKSVFNIDLIKSRLLRLLSEHTPKTLNMVIDDDIYTVIVFQILSLNEDAIIHEINHAITMNNLVSVENNGEYKGHISQAGLNYTFTKYNQSEKLLEELMNEKASLEITDIFKRKGGSFSEFCLDVPFEYVYHNNFYLVDEFYDKFKEYIKKARISENKNELIKRIGDNNYKSFLELIGLYYSRNNSVSEIDKNKAMIVIRALINKMENNLIKENSVQEDVNSYINELNTQGYKVKVLNDTEDVEYNTERARVR